MSRKKELARNTAILTFGKICTQCISFFLLPLYTALLNTADYGVFDLIGTYALLLLPLVNWQMDQGIFRFLLDSRNNEEKKKELLSTVLIVNVIQALGFSIIIFIISKFIFVPYYKFLIVNVILHVFTALLLQFLRGVGKNTQYAIASFISASSTVMLNVFFLVVLQYKIVGLFLATCLAQAITLVYLCIVVSPWKYFKICSVKKEVFVDICKYSVPLIPNNIAWWIVNVSDRTIVSFVLGVAINGIYTVANKFSNIFIQFYNILNLSWTETVSLHYNDDDRDEFFCEMITTMYKLFSCACLGIIAIMPFIFPVMIDKKYEDAYYQIIILMYAMLMRVIVGLYSCIYVATKNSKKIAITSVSSAIINILFNILFISKIGLYAASLSTFIAFGSMAVIRYIDVNKIIRMKIKGSVFISSLIISIVLGITYYYNNLQMNIIMLVIIFTYSVFMNRELLVTLLSIVTKRIKKG